jgi:hypothetical protein
MPLHTHGKGMFGRLDRFHQTILGGGDNLKTRSNLPDCLMVKTVDPG